MRILEKLAQRERDARACAPQLICCLGDSVTHGCFEVFFNEKGQIDTVYEPWNGYAALLERRLRALYPAAAVNVLNAGISGDNATGALARLERDVLSRKPDLVTVNLALNDAMNPDVEAGLAAYAAAMGEIMDRVLASGAECMLVTPNFMCAYVSHALQEEGLRAIARDAGRVQNEGILARYVAVARAEAERRRVPIADAFARWQALASAGVDTTKLLSNHINHPTREAHGMFVEAILAQLLQEA